MIVSAKPNKASHVISQQNNNVEEFCLTSPQDIMNALSSAQQSTRSVAMSAAAEMEAIGLV